MEDPTGDKQNRYFQELNAHILAARRGIETDIPDNQLDTWEGAVISLGVMCHRTYQAIQEKREALNG